MKLAARICNLALLAAAASLAVQIFYNSIVFRVKADGMLQTAVKAAGSTPEAAAFPRTGCRVIVDRNLFGSSTAPAAVSADENLAGLEETTLDLKLWGTASGAGDRRYAVIEVKGGRSHPAQQVLLHEGDTVQTATIERILADQVVLNQDGRKQVLRMQKFHLGGGMARRPIYGASVPRTFTQRRHLRRARIEKSISDLNNLATEVRITPVNDGMRFSAIKPGSLFRRLGLYSGDIITRIDGRPINSVDDALGFIQNLRTSDAISIELRRRGRFYKIMYTIR